MGKYRRAILIALAALAGLAVLSTLGYYADRYMEKHTYMLAYAGRIKENSREYALDPYLVAAVIYAESRYQPEAISPKGAVGLMQIMPDTGAWIAEKLDEGTQEDFEPERLKDPALNIRYGCWYLRFLLDRFDGDAHYAVIAYNAGHGNLEKWLKDEVLSPDGALANIPFEETDTYVRRVMQAREKYKELYAEELGQ